MFNFITLSIVDAYSYLTSREHIQTTTCAQNVGKVIGEA